MWLLSFFWGGAIPARPHPRILQTWEVHLHLVEVLTAILVELESDRQPSCRTLTRGWNHLGRSTTRLGKQTQHRAGWKIPIFNRKIHRTHSWWIFQPAMLDFPGVCNLQEKTSSQKWISNSKTLTDDWYFHSVGAWRWPPSSPHVVCGSRSEGRSPQESVRQPDAPSALNPRSPYLARLALLFWTSQQKMIDFPKENVEALR